MFGGVLRITVDHHPGLPAAQVFQLVAARSCLPVPRCPGVAQIVEPEVPDAGLPQRRVPCIVCHFPADRFSPESEAEPLVLSELLPQHDHGIGIQRDARARFFMSNSSAGKSKFARCSNGRS